MKKICLLFFLSSYGLACSCQTDDLSSFERQRLNITKKGMLGLGSFAAANIVIGAVASNTSNRQAHYFNQMNLIWGSANLLLAGVGYWGASKENATGVTLSSVLLHQAKIEKTFLFNAGLDIAYITGGLYLTERSRRNADPSKLKGYGNAVMLQGGFLLLFDGIMYTLHHQHGKKLTFFTDKVTVIASPASITLICRL